MERYSISFGRKVSIEARSLRRSFSLLVTNSGNAYFALSWKGQQRILIAGRIEKEGLKPRKLNTLIHSGGLENRVEGSSTSETTKGRDVDWIEANRDCARLAKISVTEDGEREREKERRRKGKREGGSGTSGGKEKKHRLDRSFRYRSNTRR